MNEAISSSGPSAYRVVVFGATSAIAGHTLRSIASEREASFLLIGRNETHLSDTTADLISRGAEARWITADLCDPLQDWDSYLKEDTWDLFLIAHGSLPDQESTLADRHAIGREIDINFISPVRIAAACTRIIERQKSGTLAIFGSVAGDRGRQSNYLYGSTKAALEIFTEGLRHRLAPLSQASVVLLKPGMTDTPMTAGIRKGPLFSSAESVGALAWRAIKRGSHVAYLPGWWRWLMITIRSLPFFVFSRTKL